MNATANIPNNGSTERGYREGRATESRIARSPHTSLASAWPRPCSQPSSPRFHRTKAGRSPMNSTVPTAEVREHELSMSMRGRLRRHPPLTVFSRRVRPRERPRGVSPVFRPMYASTYRDRTGAASNHRPRRYGADIRASPASLARDAATAPDCTTCRPYVVDAGSCALPRSGRGRRSRTADPGSADGSADVRRSRGKSCRTARAVVRLDCSCGACRGSRGRWRE